MSLPTLPMPMLNQHLYTRQELETHCKAFREHALEEAAQICDERANNENDAQWCADRIRSLK